MKLVIFLSRNISLNNLSFYEFISRSRETSKFYPNFQLGAIQVISFALLKGKHDDFDTSRTIKVYVTCSINIQDTFERQ